MIFMFSVYNVSFMKVRAALIHDSLVSLLCVITGNTSRMAPRAGTKLRGKVANGREKFLLFEATALLLWGSPSRSAGDPVHRTWGPGWGEGNTTWRKFPEPKWREAPGVPRAGLHPGPDGMCALWKQCWTNSLKMEEIITVCSYPFLTCN